MTTRREPAMDSAEGRHAHALRDDSLLQSIAWLTRVHGRERSPESLVSGVPFSGGLSPKDALRVLDQAGYNAGIVERRLLQDQQDLIPGSFARGCGFAGRDGLVIGLDIPIVQAKQFGLVP